MGKKYIYILAICTFIMIILESVVFASMADYTDEQADQQQQQQKEETKHEIEERVNKSSNNYLKSLTIKNYEITPDFDKQTINYELSQEVKEDSIEIEAETDDEKASVSGTGIVKLENDENEFKINVTAENGTSRAYYIKAKKFGSEEKKTESSSENTTKTESSAENTKKDEKKLIFIIGVIVVAVIFVLLIIKIKK